MLNVDFFIMREIASQLKISVTEQRTDIKFCVLLQKSPAEITTMLHQTHGKGQMTKSQVCDLMLP